jgi:hypothetical protein
MSRLLKPVSDQSLTEAWRDSATAVPPASLDAAVLEAARGHLAQCRAEKERSGRARRRPSWLSWAVPVSAVAVAGLGLLLSLRVADDDEARRYSERAPVTAPAASVPAAEPRPGQAAEMAGQRGSAVVPAAPVNLSAQTAAAKPAAPARAPSSPPEKSAGSEPDRAAGTEQRSGMQARPQRHEPAQPQAAEAALPKAITASPLLPAETTGFGAAVEAPVGASSAPSLLDDRGPAAAAVMPREALEKRKREASAELTEPRSATAWITRLQAMLREGQVAEARAGLREFVVRYPDYPLPDDLAGLNAN